MDYEKWLEMGERLGLKGTDLQQFVERKEKEYLDREQRMIERQDRQRREDEERRFEMDKQRAIEAETQRHHEIEVLRLKAEMAQQTGDAGLTDSTPGKALRPKLPKFEEGKDDMDAYLERFERFAVSQKWHEYTWAVSLSSLLTGKGLEVCASMPPDQASDYKALKTAVLKRYQLTEEGFRLKFRDSKPEHGETVVQFMARLTRYFKRWQRSVTHTRVWKICWFVSSL